MFLPGERLDGGRTSAGALGCVGDPRWTPGRGSERSFAGNAAKPTRTLQTRRPLLQLKTFGIFVEEEFIVFLASSVTESPKVEKGTAVYLKVETDSLDPAERTTTSTG